MRKLVGIAVLVAGVGALGYVGTTTHAARIQSDIQTRAAGLAASWLVEARVSGRDVVLTGAVENIDTTRQAFAALDGVRAVDAAGLTVLPVADPFELMVAHDGHVSGVVPPTANRASLGGGNLVVAAGVPDADWVDVATRAVQAAPVLQSGEITLRDRDVILDGVVADPDARDAILAILGPLPEGYSLSDQLTLLDDGTPLRLDLTVRDGVVSGAGKVAAGVTADAITSGFSGGSIDVVQSIIEDPDWQATANTSVRALTLLIEGRLLLDGATVTLSGSGTPDAIAAARDILAPINGTTDLAVWDDGAPFALTMEWDGARATASGKYPAGFDPRGPAAVAVTSDAARSFLQDTDGNFTSNADAGVAALGLLEQGQLGVSPTAITLTGAARSPRVDATLDGVFARVSPDVTVTRDIVYLDDGSPAAWVLAYSATTGGRIDGRLPAALTPQDISDALGIAGVSGAPTFAVDDGDARGARENLALVAAYLPEVEQLTYTADADGTTLDIVVSPGVDLDLVAIDLAERLPVDVVFSLAPLDPLPAEGTVRRNQASGLDERFRNGFWIPTLDFAADPDGCDAQVTSVLTRAQITFLSGSARLDAASIRAINALAAVAQPCLDAGLALEIGGHTDATGSSLDNEVLSFDRATSVLDALAARGVSRDDMVAIGYGQAQPVADNSTAEGRAANRRTTFTWSIN